MVKLDLLFLLFAYLLRMTRLLLFNLVIPNSSYVYNYWFHSTDNARMRNDVTTWMLHITYRLLLELIYGVYFIVQCPFNVLQWTISVVLWWPKFYWELMRDPGGRSLFEICLLILVSEGALREPSLQYLVSPDVNFLRREK